MFRSDHKKEIPSPSSFKFWLAITPTFFHLPLPQDDKKAESDFLLNWWGKTLVKYPNFHHPKHQFDHSCVETTMHNWGTQQLSFFGVFVETFFGSFFPLSRPQQPPQRMAFQAWQRIKLQYACWWNIFSRLLRIQYLIRNIHIVDTSIFTVYELKWGDWLTDWSTLAPWSPLSPTSPRPPWSPRSSLSSSAC